MIIRQIETALFNFESLTKQEASCIYLGDQQWVALAAHMDAEDAPITLDDSPDNRPEFWGRKIYKVNEPDFLHVGL